MNYKHLFVKLSNDQKCLLIEYLSYKKSQNGTEQANQRCASCMYIVHQRLYTQTNKYCNLSVCRLVESIDLGILPIHDQVIDEKGLVIILSIFLILCKNKQQQQKQIENSVRGYFFLLQYAPTEERHTTWERSFLLEMIVTPVPVDLEDRCPVQRNPVVRIFIS